MMDLNPPIPGAKFEKRKSGPAREHPLTVTELSRRITRLLEGQIGRVAVQGEISNFRMPSSGHAYFVLKDEQSAINAVCFRSTLSAMRVALADGKKLEVRGRVTAYTARSEYQIIVESAQEVGLGDLMRRFIELRDKLKAEGLFDLSRKKPLPELPRVIGIVTSSTGAALRDMLNVLNRRAGGLTIVLSSCAVQGVSAPEEITCAIRLLERRKEVEVIIVGRGGGSIEDLWAFNDERVVRAITACKIPVVSAVGHETDTTLSDYAADLRAPTPSAAAEIVTAHYSELLRKIQSASRSMSREMFRHIETKRRAVAGCDRSWGMRSPLDRLSSAMQRIDDLDEKMNRASARRIERIASQLRELRSRLHSTAPARKLENAKTALFHLKTLLENNRPDVRWLPRLEYARGTTRQLSLRLVQALHRRMREERLRLEGIQGRLESVGPSSVLNRGFSIITNLKGNKIVTSPDQVSAGQTLRVESAGGKWKVAALPNAEELFDAL